jgi:hypothetical protein
LLLFFKKEVLPSLRPQRPQSLPPLEQPHEQPDRSSALAGQAWVAVEQHGGILVGHAQQAFVRHRIGETPSWLAGLPLAEQVAAAAYAEILVGDGEAVFRVAQQRQAPARRLGQPVVVQEKAEA